MGMIEEGEFESASVVRLRRAYPLYTGDYRERLETVMRHLGRFENLQTTGRNAIFRYTSAGYYIEMGMKAAENLPGNSHDLRVIGESREYAEA